MTGEGGVVPNKTVPELILDWSKNKPDWQRDALRRIVEHGSVTDEDIRELVALAKKTQGDNDIELDAVLFSKDDLPNKPDDGLPVAIASISEVVGVNQLAPNQTLPFSNTGITIIYGQNGSGKSGYIRILKRACLSRKAGKIQGNVYDTESTAPSAKISAQIGTEVKTLDWQDEDQPLPEVSSVTVFDRDAGTVHVREKNEVWFRPFGLDIPDELAGVCIRVKQELEVEKSALVNQKNAIFDSPIWSKNSSIGQFMNAITEKSKTDNVFDNAGLSEQEKTRLAQLEVDLIKDPNVAAAEQNQIASSVNALISFARRDLQTLEDQSIQEFRGNLTDAATKRQLADAAASSAFGHLDIEGVGGDLWRGLWDAARRFSATVGENGTQFPPDDGGLCVLCHQGIDLDTHNKMAKFDEFITDDTEKQAVVAENALAIATQKIANVSLDIRPFSSGYRALKLRNMELAHKSLRLIAVCRLRRWACTKAKTADDISEQLKFDLSVFSELEDEIDSIRQYATTLAEAVDLDVRATLVSERDELKDRKQADSIEKIADVEILRLIKINRIKKCLSQTSTNAITILGNKIADDVVTPKMRDRFQDEIVRLADNQVRVEVVRSGGRFGSPQYEVRFFAAPAAKVHNVLSEGEQTCVALAAYLTELANTSNCSALVFDDPVTSLDSRWRGKVAKRLVEESKKRQIIVFSHDLVFVNDLQTLAQEFQIPTKLSSLTRGSQGIGLVNEGLPWRAAKVAERLDKLEKIVRAAKKLYDAGDEEDYQRAGLSFYDDLRSTWERGLEDYVFAGVVLRHRDYINTKNLPKVTALSPDDVVIFQAAYKRCCDFVPSHDLSRARDIAIPAPNDLESDIQTLKDWVSGIKARQNLIS